MAKVFFDAFAADGDKVEIPDEKQLSGELSIEEGWSDRYEAAPEDPDYLPVDRREMNGLFNAVTKSIGRLQAHGFSYYADSSVGWPKGAVVIGYDGRLWKNVQSFGMNTDIPRPSTYVSQIENEQPVTWELVDAPAFGEGNNLSIIGPSADSAVGKSVFVVASKENFNEQGLTRSVYVGCDAGKFSGDGDQNVAIGWRALGKLADENNPDPTYCVAIGSDAMGGAKDTLADCVAIGDGAMSQPKNDVKKCTALGVQSLPLADGIENTTAIGFGAGSGAASNSIYLGNNAITDIFAKVNITTTSDIRDKTEMEPVPLGLEFINKIQPIKYRFNAGRGEDEKDEARGKVRLGFSAQEVHEHQGTAEIATYDEKQDRYHIDMTEMVPILCQAVKELLVRVENLEKMLAAAEQKDV